MSADRAADSDPRVYTLRDFSQRPAEILSEVREHGRPAFITEYGRFIASITPLADGEVESVVLAAMAREIGAGLDRA